MEQHLEDRKGTSVPYLEKYSICVGLEFAEQNKGNAPALAE